jgi:hypothetical protein
MRLTHGLGHTAVATLALAVALAGCGGDDDEGKTDEGCDEAEVVVTVTDPEGAAVTGALVEVEDQACVEAAGGVYTCAVPSGGEYRVYVTQPGFIVYAETVDVAAGACELSVAAVMAPDIAY